MKNILRYVMIGLLYSAFAVQAEEEMKDTEIFSLTDSTDEAGFGPNVGAKDTGYFDDAKQAVKTDWNKAKEDARRTLDKSKERTYTLWDKFKAWIDEWRAANVTMGQQERKVIDKRAYQTDNALSKQTQAAKEYASDTWDTTAGKLNEAWATIKDWWQKQISNDNTKRSYDVSNYPKQRRDVDYK